MLVIIILSFRMAHVDTMIILNYRTAGKHLNLFMIYFNSPRRNNLILNNIAEKGKNFIIHM